VSTDRPKGDAAALPSGSLGVGDGVAVLVGVVVGIGIFGFPPLVAQHAGSTAVYMGLWLAGGLIMLVGSLCYAELGAAYPHAGGEYHFLHRAWGGRVSFMFAWARGIVIQTGAIAAVAFIYGEYAQQLVPLGAQGVAVHAAVAVTLLTLLNMASTRESKRLQTFFTWLTVFAIACAIVAGLGVSSTLPLQPEGMTPAGDNWAGALGMGMVFVLLTYGGWNEAVYLSGELRNPARMMPKVLLVGGALVIGIYLLVNLSYLHIFGLEGLRQSQAVGADLMRAVAGPMAAVLLSLMICLAALSTMNATILTGARVYYALGQDVSHLRALGRWNAAGDTPLRALALQGGITLALIIFGARSENGIATMVAYTAPVFWLFMLFTVAAVAVMRSKDPATPRPFRVPLYPLPILVFGVACVGLFWSSLLYAGQGAMVGLVVLIAGLPLLALRR